MPITSPLPFNNNNNNSNKKVMEGVPSASVPSAGGEDYEEIREQVSGHLIFQLWNLASLVSDGLCMQCDKFMRRY